MTESDVVGRTHESADADPKAGVNVLFWAFVATSVFPLVVCISTYANARWQNPWPPHRISQSVLLWLSGKGPMEPVLILAIPFGFTVALVAPTRRKRLFAWALTAMVVATLLVACAPY